MWRDFLLNEEIEFPFSRRDAFGKGIGAKKNPGSKTGDPNQKPLTIKPYPMKIHR